MRVFLGIVVFLAVFSGAIINEFMYNPPGSTENEEFVELKNTGPDTVNLQNWKNSGKLITSDPLFLKPDSTLVLARDSVRLKTYLDSVGVYYNCGRIFQQEGGWDALSNSGDIIVIKNALNETVDSVSYSSISCATDNGRTLQRPEGVQNWRPSSYDCSPNVGGSPNDCVPERDLTLLYIGVEPETPTSEDSIKLYPQIKNTGQTPMSGTLSLWVERVSENDTTTIDSTTISIPTITPGEIETLQYGFGPVDTGLYRINGRISDDDIDANNSRSFLKRVESPYHLIISEALTNAYGSESSCPGGECNEFVELYNYGNTPIDLAGWLFTDHDETDTIVPWRTSELGSLNRPGLLYDTTIIQPKNFALILDREYRNGNQPYNIPPGVLILTVKDNELGNGLSDSDTIDIMTPGKSVVSRRPGVSTYAKDGYSYIRCELNNDDIFRESPIIYGTPGYYSNEIEGENFEIKVEPESFNPQKTRATITVDFPRSSLYSLKIYDLKGRLVKELVREKDSTLKSITWDGKDNSGRPVEIGPYIVVGECPIKLITGCNLIEGARKTVKKVIVIGRPIE